MRAAYPAEGAEALDAELVGLDGVTTLSQVAATRDRTAERLKELGFIVLPSKSNFLFISHPVVPAAKLFGALRERGILVRYFALPRIDNFLRVTIGSEEDMETFCATLTEFVENVL